MVRAGMCALARLILELISWQLYRSKQRENNRYRSARDLFRTTRDVPRREKYAPVSLNKFFLRKVINTITRPRTEVTDV